MTGVVMQGIVLLSEKDMGMPARGVVFRMRVERLPCPGFSWKDDE